MNAFAALDPFTRRFSFLLLDERFRFVDEDVREVRLMRLAVLERRLRFVEELARPPKPAEMIALIAGVC